MSLNISITQTVGSVQILHDGTLTQGVSSYDSPTVTWNGDVVLANTAGSVIDIAPVRQAIQENRAMLVVDLDTAAQGLYVKNYDACTSAEAKAVRHKVLGDTWKAKIKALTNIDISDSNADSLVDDIIGKLSI